MRLLVKTKNTAVTESYRRPDSGPGACSCDIFTQDNAVKQYWPSSCSTVDGNEDLLINKRR